MGEKNGTSHMNGGSLGSSFSKDASELKEILSSINQPQSLDLNLKNLKASSIGGISGLVRMLKSDVDGGVASDSVDERRKILGSNKLPFSPRKSFWQLFIDTFDDKTLQILIAAAVVSLAVGLYDDPTTGYIEGVAILTAVLLVSFVTAINDDQKERQFRELSAVNDDVEVVVLRSGRPIQIPVDQIVIGDIVCLQAGDKIPCDGVLVSCDGCECNESTLTGEPLDVEKNLIDDPFVLSGCTMEAGSAQYIATAVGANSQWGIIKAHLEKEQEQTPLQEKLDDMAELIGNVGTAAAVATFIAMMVIKVFVKPAYLDEVSVFSHALDAFIIFVTIVVVAVPEGLPLAVTIALAFSTKKMLADQNLIRHLSACETMGNATNICSDKTGTLTENRMTVVKGVFADEPFEGSDQKASLSEKAKQIILQCIATCSTARVVLRDSIDSPDQRPLVIGNKTEAALIMLAMSEWGSNDGVEKRRSSARFGKEGGGRLFPFSSARKKMSVLVREPSSWMLYHKGAAETLLGSCTTYMDKNGVEKPLTATIKAKYEGLIKAYAADALRCIALTHRSNIDKVLQSAKIEIENCSVQDCEKYVENNLCLDALVGIADPLREEVVAAVSTCQKAGIIVRMVTGDNIDTANAIAKQAGILTKDSISMTGEHFRKLTPKQLDDILPRLRVLARSSPEDKHILVQRLNGGLMPENEEEWTKAHPDKDFATQKDLLLPGYKDEWVVSRGGVGEVVGVTGDGTNDGPALKAADVGLSMGISGTDVAKNASDIIIMDDKFSSIVKAVLWGRSVFDNIRKFLQFQLTVNVVALTITFLSAVAGYKPPLNAVMMLWVNLIMDTMGALALGTEPPADKLLNRRPYRRDASLINRPMWRNIIIQAIYQLGLLIFLLKRGPDIFGCQDGSRHHFTIMFNAFVFCQVFNEFNAREIGDQFQPFAALDKSPAFLAVIIFTVFAQWLIVEFGGDFTQTQELSEQEWQVTALLGAFSIPVGYIMRQIPIAEDPDSFAGEIPKDEQVSKEPKTSSPLALILIPIGIAVTYQTLAST